MAALPHRQRAGRGSSDRPIVTLTTDFGLADYYVAAMKAVLIGGCPEGRVIDITHQVPPQDVLAGAIVLERAIASFGRGTVHLAVVDPGVGTSRRAIVAEIAGQRIVCPDNGLITWAWRRHDGGGRVYEITWKPSRAASATFHGRDLFAPVAARLAAGERLAKLARPIPGEPVLLPIAPATSLRGGGEIIHIDHFGNATTNVPCELLPDDMREVGEVRVKGRSVGKLRRTYGDVAIGNPLALVGSSGLLEIAVRDGSAARKLRLKVGDVVGVRSLSASPKRR